MPQVGKSNRYRRDSRTVQILFNSNHISKEFLHNAVVWTVHSNLCQSCLTLCDPMNWSPPGSSVCVILQPRILEWVAVSYARGSSRPTDWTKSLMSSALADGFFTTWEAKDGSLTYSKNVRICFRNRKVNQVAVNTPYLFASQYFFCVCGTHRKW